MANYEPRLSQEGSVSLVLNVIASANAPRSTGHSQVVHLGVDGASNTFQVGESASPWTRHQERAHRLSAYARQPPVGDQYVGEGIPRINAQSVPRYDETSDDDNYQPGLGAQYHYGTHEPGLAHPDVTRGCQERLYTTGHLENPLGTQSSLLR